MWGGCSEGGFAVVTFHKFKKMNTASWVATVKRGCLTKAIKDLKPVRVNGPWTVLCDDESFLGAKDTAAAHKAAKISLCNIPAHSPDLNPVERFWAWLRSKLRAMDLQDAVAHRPVLGRAAYIARVRAVCKTKKAQAVAASQAKLMKRVCKAVITKKGAATGF